MVDGNCDVLISVAIQAPQIQTHLPKKGGLIYENSKSETERKKMRSKEDTQFSPRNPGHLNSSQGEGAKKEAVSK